MKKVMAAIMMTVLFLLAAGVCLNGEGTVAADRRNTVVAKKERGLADRSQNHIEAEDMAVNPIAEEMTKMRA